MKKIGGEKRCEKMKVLWKEEDGDEMKGWEKEMREDEGALRVRTNGGMKKIGGKKGRAENVNIESALK